MNDKTPLNKWKNKNNHFKIIDINTYNVGFLTGNINNLVVVERRCQKGTQKRERRDGQDRTIYYR